MKPIWGNITALIGIVLFATTICNAGQTSWWFVPALSGLLYLAYLALIDTVNDWRKF